MAQISDERAYWLGQNVLPHEPQLRAWLNKKNLGGLEVDDVIQDTYAKLITLESITHILHVKSYMFQIAASIVGQHHRRSKIISIASVSDFESRDFIADEPSPEHIAIDRDELNHLTKAIGTLPDKVRQVFTLRRVHGLSQREVAIRMALAESTVEKHMRKGFELLSALIACGGNLPPEASRGVSARTRTTHTNAKKDSR